MPFAKGVCRRALSLASALVAVTLLTTDLSRIAKAQDQDQDDPPGRVARLGYVEGSVSFQPAGENEWIEAVPNRPLTTGDKLWADRDSRAEIQLGSAMIDLAPNTGFSFLNLDDQTIQMEVTAGTIGIRVWNLDQNNIFEVDTPNQAFTVTSPGRYRVQTSENGDYTVVTIREGTGESTGNGQSYTLHSGQRTTFRGTTSLNAEVEPIGGPDDFDNWTYRREGRYDDSPSARYCSRRVVGFEDLDDNGDWRPYPEYGAVWFPHVEPGWAPYHYGHWAWIDPWGWTWVDDANWGYAPFHYGRWVSVEGRWGWIPGPREERPVYAPALVAFVGGGPGAGGAVAWFPLGPREVYVPSYRVSQGYVNRVNITNTTVNVTQVTNVYNTTIVRNNTTINNVTYVNRNVRGAVTAVPQHAFASAQPVAKAAVAVNPSQFANVPVSSRAAVPPAPQAVLGAHANTAGRVAAPPAAVASRQVIARTAPPPPPPSFAARQQVLAQHPGQPVARQELQRMAPPAASAAASRVNVVKATRPAPAPAPANQPANRPGNTPTNAPGTNPAQPARPQPGTSNQPGGRPFEPPARNDRPVNGQPAQPAPNNRPNEVAPNNRPGVNEPTPNNRPAEPMRNDRPPTAQPNRPEMNQPNPNNRPAEPPRNEHPTPTQPNRPEMNQPNPNNRPAEPPRNERPEPNNRPTPETSRPQPSQPPTNRPETNHPEPRNEAPSPRNEAAPRQQTPPPAAQHPQPQNRPAPPPQQREPNKPKDKEEKPKPQ